MLYASNSKIIINELQLIELKRNPLGAPVRQARGVVQMKVHNDATSLNDKLRIANKVNTKYLDASADKSKMLENLELELGMNYNQLIAVSNNNKPGKPPYPGVSPLLAKVKVCGLFLKNIKSFNFYCHLLNTT